MMICFCGHFYCVSNQQLNSNKFKDFKTFEYYGIRIETFKLTTEEYRRIKKTGLRNQNSNYMMKDTSGGPKNLFVLDDFSNYVTSNQRSFRVRVYFVNSEGTEEFVQY